MFKPGDTYKVKKQIYGWTPGETVIIDEIDNPPGFIDVSNGYSKVTLRSKDLQEYVRENALELEFKKQTCYTCSYKLYEGFRESYEYCVNCGKVKNEIYFRTTQFKNSPIIRIKNAVVAFWFVIFRHT